MKIEAAIALITGGASGLGAGTARRFIDKGARVVVLDRDDDKGNSLAAELGEQARFVKADVSSEAEVQAALEYTATEFGGLNVLVNCAGIGAAIRTTSSRGAHPLDAFVAVIRVNLIGSFNGIRVCTIAPGIFGTPLLGSLPQAVRASLGAQVPFPQRLGQPAEYAQLAQQIVENEMLNGETIRLDGALRMQSS